MRPPTALSPRGNFAERATGTAYAHDLKGWFSYYLDGGGLGWETVNLKAVAGFVAWLRPPPVARSGAVAVLPTVGHRCTASSVNAKVAAVSAFYEFRAAAASRSPICW